MLPNKNQTIRCGTVFTPNTQEVLDCLRTAVAAELERKRRLGHYAVMWRDGRPALIGDNAPLTLSKAQDSGSTELALCQLFLAGDEDGPVLRHRAPLLGHISPTLGCLALFPIVCQRHRGYAAGVIGDLAGPVSEPVRNPQIRSTCS